MAIRINDSFLGDRAVRNFSASSMRVARSFERLATGKRINRPADDRTGYIIATGMNAQLRVIGQVIRNVNDGVTLAQTADAALSQTTLLLQQIRQFSEESSVAAIDKEQRFGLQVEAKRLLDEIDRLGETTRFNDIPLLDGQVAALRLQSGGDVGDDITVRVKPITVEKLGLHVRQIGLEVDPTFPIEEDGVVINDVMIRPTVDADDPFSSVQRAGSAIAKAKAINDSEPFSFVNARALPAIVNGSYPEGGELNDEDNFRINGVVFRGFEVLAGDSNKRLRNEINARIEETGVRATVDQRYNLVLTAEDGRNIELETNTVRASEITGLNEGRIGVELFGGSLLLRSASVVSLELEILDMDSALGLGDGLGQYYLAPSNKDALGTIDITTQAGAERAVEIVDVALEDVERTRGDLSGVLSRLNSALSSTETRRIYLELSRRRVEDTNYASELTDLARDNIVRQASSSLLAQSNFGPENALSLLQNFESSVIGAGDGIRRIGIESIARRGNSGVGLRGLSGNPFGFDSNLFRPANEAD